MRRWLARQMLRPWVARTACTVAFVAIMAAVRSGLVALRDTRDTGLIALVCVPIIVGSIALGFWIDRRRAY